MGKRIQWGMGEFSGSSSIHLNAGDLCSLQVNQVPWWCTCIGYLPVDYRLQATSVLVPR